MTIAATKTTRDSESRRRTLQQLWQLQQPWAQPLADAEEAALAEDSEVDSVEDSEEDVPAAEAHPEDGDKVSGVRDQMSGIRCKVSGVRLQVSGVRCQASGIWTLDSGLWLLFLTESQSGVLIGEFNCQ